MEIDHHTRALARAIASGDLPGAATALDLLVRDEVLDQDEVENGRTEAAVLRRRANGVSLPPAA